MEQLTIRTILALAVLALPAHAVAATVPDASACGDPQAKANAVVAACTAAIASAGGDKTRMETILLDRAYGFMDAHAFDQALKDCDSAIGLQPRDARAFICRGTMEGELGRLDLAVKDLDHALQLKPGDILALKNRAYAFEMKKDFASAAADYTALIRLQPGNFEFWNDRCWDHAVIGKQLDAALSDCDQALKINPKDANSYNSRGFVHFRMKQYAEAIRDYDAANATDPKRFGSSYYVRGLAKLALGDASGAADVAKGKAIEPGIAQRFAGYGVAARR